nr:hypothetical protein [Tanacetum cinerariifolium]
MVNLTFADTHNMVVFLSKSDASAGFDQIMDFLNPQAIQYALMVNPTIYVSCIKQFWATISIKKANNVVKLRALVDGKRVIFTELARVGYEKPPTKLTFFKAFFSAQWKFLIHTLVQCISAKRTECNEFSCLMASAVIYLATGRKFNFSKYIFDSMVRNMDSPSKFLMYLWFLQVIINAQVDDLSSHNNQYTSPALTQKVFANMRRVGKGFSGVETPLFAIMLVQPQPPAAEEVDDVEVPAAQEPSPIIEPSPPPQEPITTPLQAQPATPSLPPQVQSTTTSESSMTLLNTLIETCATLSQKVAALEQDKIAQELEIFKLKKRVKKLKKKRRSKSSGLNILRKMGTSQRVESSIETVVGAQEDASKRGGMIEARDANEDITLVDTKTQVDLGAELQGRKDNDNVAIKEVGAAIKDASAAEPTVFDDEEMDKRLHDEEVEQATAREKQEKEDLEKAKVLQQQKFQSLKRKPISIAQAEKNMIVYLKNMARYKMGHFKGMNYDKVRPIFEREYNKVQNLFKPDKDEEPTKKRVAKETLLQESIKKLKAAKVSGSESTQDTPTVDPKEMSEEDVKKIIRVSGITQAYQSFEDMLTDFDREDLDVLWRLVKEKFNSAVPTVDKEKAL